MTPLQNILTNRVLPWASKNSPYADVVFFEVSLNPDAPPTAQELTEALRAHQGAFVDLDPLDSREHSYIDLGAWVGDQSAALKLMGAGSLLGMWDLLSPYTILGLKRDIESERLMATRMAERGYLSIMARP